MDQVDHHKIHECQDSASFGPTLDRWRSYAVFVNCDFVVLSYSSQCCRFFLTLIEGLRKEDVVHCTDCKAHWGNVIVIWGFYGHQVCLAKANSAASLDTVVVQDLSLGEGQAVENGDSLEVVYTGWLLQNHVIGQVTRFFFTSVSSFCDQFQWIFSALCQITQQNMNVISDVWLEPEQGQVATTESWSWKSDQSESIHNVQIKKSTLSSISMKKLFE